MDDFNAKIGERQQGEEHVMRHPYYGEKNEREEILINFATQNQ